jgi:hypothetical protein
MTADNQGHPASYPGAKRENSNKHFVLQEQNSSAMSRRPVTPNRASDNSVGCSPGSHSTRVFLIDRGGLVVEAAASPPQASSKKQFSGPASPSTPVGTPSACAKHGFLVPSPNEQARLLANAARAARLARLDQVAFPPAAP